MTRQLSAVGKRERRQAGFVLLDLVVTTAIACLVLGLILPHLPFGMTPPRMQALVADVASLMRDARTSAMVENRDVAVSFESSSRLFADGRASIVVPSEVEVDMMSGGGCNSGADVAELIFHGDGTSCGGVIRFGSQAGAYTLRVNWATGYVEALKN